MDPSQEDKSLILHKRKRVLDDQVCRVCGDQCTGKHYGVYSCDGCSGFFKRTTRRPERWVCKYNGACGVDKNSRNECKACRLNKCVEAGMTTEGMSRRSRIFAPPPAENSTSPLNAHVSLDQNEAVQPMEVVDIAKSTNGNTIHRPLTALNTPLNSDTVVIKSEIDLSPPAHSTPAHAPQGNIASRTIIQKPSTSVQYQGPVVNKSNDNPPMFTVVTCREPAEKISFSSLINSTSQSQPKSRLVTSTHAQSTIPAAMNGSVVYRQDAKYCSLSELLKAVEPVHFHSTENINDAAMRLMTSSIRFARNLACFTKIPFRDQIILLEESWKKLFLLDAAYWALPLEIASLLNVATGTDDPAGRHIATEIRTVQELLTHLRSFRWDVTELACLKAIVIFRPETKGLKDAQTIDKIQDEVQLLLSSHVTSVHPNYPARFGKLLLSLLQVQNVADKPIEEVLFKVTNDKDIFETLLSKLIDS